MHMKNSVSSSIFIRPATTRHSHSRNDCARNDYDSGHIGSTSRFHVAFTTIAADA
jgi:hypothetical protein